MASEIRKILGFLPDMESLSMSEKSRNIKKRRYILPNRFAHNAAHLLVKLPPKVQLGEPRRTRTIGIKEAAEIFKKKGNEIKNNYLLYIILRDY